MEKIKKYLGLARNAGYLIIGSDKLDGYTKKLYLILIDETAGNNAFKIANKHKANGIEVQTIKHLAELVDISNCKIVGLKNKGLSEEILKNLSLTRQE